MTDRVVTDPGGLPGLPGDLDVHLARSEARFDDLTPGVEKRIRWAGSPAATEWSVVYLHGFSATHRETAPFSELLADGLGANLFLTRLTGHGRPGTAMGELTVDALLADAAEAVEVGRRIGRRVAITACSTGGTLALWAAASDRWREVLGAMVLVSPNLGLRDWRSGVLTKPLGTLIARALQGSTYSVEPHNEDHGRYWTTAYPTRALVPMMRLVERVRAVDFGRIRIPTLTFYSRDDTIVDPEWVERMHGRLGSERKELVEIDDSGDPDRHVIAGEILSPETTGPMAERAKDFVRGLSAVRTGRGDSP